MTLVLNFEISMSKFGDRLVAKFQSQLYRNRGDGTFEDVTVASGVRAILEDADLSSVAAADYDHDGDIDLYVGNHPHDTLLRNNGDGTFVDGTIAAGMGGPASTADRSGRSKITSFGDFDGDGHMDVVSASSTFNDDTPKAYILRNRGNGTFEDMTEQWALDADVRGNPCAVLWSDIDNDGDQDLWIWHDRGDHVLLENDNGERFVDITAASNTLAPNLGNPMGIDSADIDHDGDLDTYISDVGKNALFRNDGGNRFTDISAAAGTLGTFGWGLGFEDLNADSWFDLFVTQEDNLPYLVFEHEGNATPSFIEREFAHPNVVSGNGAHNVATAFADYDHDGRTDMVVATTDGTPVVLYRNVTDLGSHRWLEVAVDRAPGSTERGGVSARVAVKTGELIQFKDITGGSSRASQNELSVRFGLGNWTGAEWVAVLWPDGRNIAVTGVEGNQRLRLIPGTRTVSAVLPTSRSVQVGVPATAFATLINSGDEPAEACGLSPATAVAGTFSYQTTDPATNTPVGTADTPVDIAAGGSQSFVFALTPTAPFVPTDVELTFRCANTNPAPVVTNLNTLLVGADAGPVPDVIALSATLTEDGVARLPAVPGSVAFGIAAANVGTDAVVDLAATSAADVTLSWCQTDAAAACVTPSAPTSTPLPVTIDGGATPTFSVFATAVGDVPFEPATNRIVVTFTDTATGRTVGATSVAVTTASGGT